MATMEMRQLLFADAKHLLLPLSNTLRLRMAGHVERLPILAAKISKSVSLTVLICNLSSFWVATSDVKIFLAHKIGRMDILVDMR